MSSFATSKSLLTPQLFPILPWNKIEDDDEALEGLGEARGGAKERLQWGQHETQRPAKVEEG